MRARGWQQLRAPLLSPPHPARAPRPACTPCCLMQMRMLKEEVKFKISADGDPTYSDLIGPLKD